MSSLVVIEHKDFENLIKIYARPKALLYCEQPYHATERYYCVRFMEADHIRLRDTLSDIKGKFLLPYNDDEFIRKRYKDFKTEAVERQNNISGWRFLKN
ncbi:MAG: DNA adenine methylase [Oscillospiraceae bacterium]|nr:DNA adenine methylase [Oscillospiraceae bacterium]